MFSATAGSKDVKAELEILPDGTYRYLILEPCVLMLVGMGKGNWSREATLLTLSRVSEKDDGNQESVSSTFPANGEGLEVFSVRTVGEP